MSRLSGFSGKLIEAWDWLVASDPGLTRLQMAGSAATGVASALIVEFIFATLTHAGAMGTIISMILGAVVNMMGMMALNGPKIWPKIRTAVFFPVALGIGLLFGVLVQGHTDIMLIVFVVIMFAAVVIRQYGIPFFFYGFMGWMGYFFAIFTKATFGLLPQLLAAIGVATIWVLLLSSTILRMNPRKNLNRTINAFRSRARTMISECADLLLAIDEKQRYRQARRLSSKQIKLSEAALIVEGWSAEEDALPAGQSAPLLRRRLIDVQHVLDRLIASVGVLVQSDGAVKAAAAGIAERLGQREDENIKTEVRKLFKLSESLYKNGDLSGTEGAAEIHLAVRQFSESVLEFVELARQVNKNHQDKGSVKEDNEEFEPVVQLFLGNLPGSPAIARDVTARGSKWNPLARMSMVNRQALQVALAGALAIYFGRELSPARYYWAVIAAFVMFTGTGTRSETFYKGLNRVLGTFIGLIVAIGVAHLTAGHVYLMMCVIVACIFCGFYLVRISYGFMMFFITIMIGQLYTIMNMLSPSLLALRLEETVIGALIGFAVALIFVPLSTRDTIRVTRNNLLNDLAEVLKASGDKLKGEEEQQELDALTLALDNRVRQLSLVTKPLTNPANLKLSPRVRHRLELYAAIANGSRALTVALRQPETSVADDLAAACESLAEAAEQMAEQTSKLRNEEAEEPLAAAENALFKDLSVPPSEVATDPIYSRVLHLQCLLQELYDNPADPL